MRPSTWEGLKCIAFWMCLGCFSALGISNKREITRESCWCKKGKAPTAGRLTVWFEVKYFIIYNSAMCGRTIQMLIFSSLILSLVVLKDERKTQFFTIIGCLPYREGRNAIRFSEISLPFYFLNASSSSSSSHRSECSLFFFNMAALGVVAGYPRPV